METYELREQTEDYSGFVRTERERPTPGADEVLIRVRACSLNYRDLAIANSTLTYPGITYPVVPLSDAAGEIVSVGDAVDRFSDGDRVTTHLSSDWIDGDGSSEKLKRQLGSTLDGVLSQYFCAPAESVVALPDHVSFTEGATLPCAGLTAWHALFEQGELFPGESVLVIGTGGVSTFALQFAELSGATTVVTSSSDEKLERARELGASETINYRNIPEWGEAVRDCTSGGVEHVIEVGGQGTLQRSLQAAAENGHIHLIGVLTGKGGNINPSPILHKPVTVEGILGVGSRAMFERMNRAIAAAELTPVVDRVFEFDDIQRAYQYTDDGNHQGKVVLTVD